MKVLRAIWPVLGLWALLIAIQLFGSTQSIVFQRDVTSMLINVVLVVGLYVFAGTSGVLSFGQMSFMAVGAYATAILTIPTIQKGFLLPDLPGFLAHAHLGTLPAAIVAGLVAAAVAAVIALPIVRLAGLAASLAMFAVLVIVHEVARNWDAVTRGSRTMIGVPTNTTGTVALLWALVIVALAYAYQVSNSGLRLRASREDEYAARAVGVDVTRDRAIAFVLSSFVIGIGGFLYAQFQGAFDPNEFFTEVTFLTIAMLVIGGMKSLAGAVVGAASVSLLTNLFDSIENGLDLGPVHFGGRPGLSALLLASFFLAVLIWRREGLTHGRELVLRVPGRGIR
ncbi:MAG TPA: branched-chain amino acid ABC transporter permease [Solirubrobacteraceae bacterium]|nr:branched-chain amino acid ABC transporter permease [Solirubrobacteraceae bacterium]